MDIISNNYIPGDQRLIDQIVRELKSQGIFDQFRKECISDVDTKPAYQNLRQRVESSVSGFLTKQTWNPEMNKNQVREMLRKNIYESGFLETGVERIVDQVVNPKITSVFLTKVEDVVYKFLGIEKPVKEEASIPPPIILNNFHDLLPTDLEAVSPEMPEEKEIVSKDIEVVKMEEESPKYEILSEKKEKFSQEENSVDSSQSSVLSALISNDSNHSQKQESVMSMNSSESRLSLAISENTSKMDGDDVFQSHKSSLLNSKPDIHINERMDIESENQDAKKEFDEVTGSLEQITNQSDAVVEKTLEDVNSKLKDSVIKKRERQHSSSEKPKSRSDKDKTKSDKYKKDEKEHSKEQPIEKEKYRIPKLSDKNKNDKRSKSKERETKMKDKYDKDRDRKSDKDKRLGKQSSERDRSKSDSRNKKDSKNDKKEKEKDDKKEKKDSKNEKSKEERKSSSSSKQKESTSSKERNKEKDKETKKINDEGKNGHSSSSSSSTRKDSSSSRHKKDDDKSRSSRRKDDKSDKDDKKKKRSSKDDHYSSKEKKNGRRSSDRDSDGPPENKTLPITPQKNSDKYSHAPTQDSFHSNSENSTDDSGNKDKIEDRNEESSSTLQLEMQKFKLPKFASNLQEAMKIMKIRKQLKKFENTNKLNSENTEMKKLLKEISEISKEGRKDETEETGDKEQIHEIEKHEVNNDSIKSLSLDINDFISSSNISIDKWNALEAKYMGEMGCTDYDSYESPYLDDEMEEEISREKTMNSVTTEEVLEKLESSANNEVEVIKDSKNDKLHYNYPIERNYSSGEHVGMNNEFEEAIEDSVDIIKCETVQFEELDSKNEKQISVINEDISFPLTKSYESIGVSSDYNKLNSKAFRSTQSDPIPNSELEEGRGPKDCQVHKLTSSKLAYTEKEINLKKKNIKFEECQRKAIVLLEKHSLAEELIQNKLTGKHVCHDDVSDNSNKDNTLKSLETEKENIQVNKMVYVERSSFTDSLSGLESTVRSMRTFERNRDTDQEVTEVTDKMKSLFEERICSNSDELFPRICEQNNIEENYHCTSVNKKNVDTSYQNSHAEITLSDVNVQKNHEDRCLGFEFSDNEKNLTILRCLIKSFENNICESIDKIKQLKYARQHNNSLYPDKVEIKDQSDISNNNFNSEGYKRKGITGDQNGMDTKKLRTNEIETEEIIDITLESNFSLPLSPAESESEKRVDSLVPSRKRRKNCKNVTSNTINKVEDCNTNSTASKFKSPLKSSRGKKSTGQRYSSEDLYKPRMYLRRTKNDPKKS